MKVWREEEYHFALFSLLLFGKRYTNSGNILAWEKKLFFFFTVQVCHSVSLHCEYYFKIQIFS